MAKQRGGMSVVALLVLLLGWLSGARAAQPARMTLAEADRHFAQKSYAAALQGYQAALQAGAVPAGRREEIAYRVAVALGKTKQWDRALETTLTFVKQHRETVWEPRALYWLGRLYLAIPHQGYRVGTRVYRGENVPKTNGDAKAEAVDLGVQDNQNARDALEAARVEFPTYRTAYKTEAEEIQLDFDLAALLQDSDFADWAARKSWAPPADPTWQVNPADAYSPAWPFPKKPRYLYAQIRMLAAQSRSSAHYGAQALFAESLWLRQYQSQMASYAVRYEKGKAVPIPYPYQDVAPEAVMQQLVKDYPNDPVRDQAEFTRAVMIAQKGRLTAALDAFHRFLAARPHSKWVSDAHAHIDAIRHHDLSLNAQTAQLPGNPPQLTIAYRNLHRVHLTLYRVPLEDLLARPAFLHNPDKSLSQFDSVFGGLKRAQRRFGPKVVAWDVMLPERGDYLSHSRTVSVPIRERGAYVVQATAPGLRAATLLTISAMAVIQKMHRDGGLCFVADARTGAPIPNAHILAKEWWNADNKQHATSLRAITNASGLATIPLLRHSGRSNFQLAVLAYRANDYALNDQEQAPDNGDNPGTFKVYSTTDRAVYRPDQTVRYRQLVMRRVRGGYQPIVHRRVKIAVQDPQGKQVFARAAVTGEFGSVSGEFHLAASCPLGEYDVEVTVPREEKDNTQQGGNRFRVEEYKKPEFEITVTPEAERVRLGEPTSAKVSARYYFGGPVPNAKVTYRVYRNAWAQTYRFPQPFDFLYHTDDNGDYNTDYRTGEVVAQSTARTDAQGEAKVTFPTKAEGERWQDSDLSYTVEADVQDSSRRTISGSGAVKATRHDVAVFLNFPHGYATHGDRVDVEIRTLNPSDQPVSVAGTAQVFRKPQTPDGKETLVYSTPLQTDSQSRALLHWTADHAGCYRIAFVTRDTARQEVSGSLDVWVAGPELALERFLFQGLFLAAQNPYYEETQSAKVLLVTQEPDCTVLLTREADNEILSKQLVHVKGRSLELSIPLTHRDAPNVYLSAVMVRHGQMYQASEELFVPPVRQFTTVTVQADKARYQPGEKAHLRLVARDWQGRPVRTELCVSISDAALGYIQKDYAPDVRAYFYGDRRSDSIQNSGSPQFGFQSAEEDTEPVPPYKQHQWLLPDGMGQLADWPGVQNGAPPLYVFSEVEPVELEKMRVLYKPTSSDERYIYYDSDRVSDSTGLSGVRLKNRRVELLLPVNDYIQFQDSSRPGAGMRKWVWPSSRYLGLGGRTGAAGGQLAQPTLRSKFLDTAFWTPAAITNAQGDASVEVTWPDNLTQWRAVAVGNTTAAQVGTGETRVTTKKDLLVRLEAPRFCVERDTVVLSAVVLNTTPDAARVKVRLDLGSDAADIEAGKGEKGKGKREEEAGGGDPAGTERAQETWVDVPQDGEKRVDWTVRVRRPGLLPIRMTAQAPTAADAEEMTIPVIVHGVERATAQSGVLRREDHTTLAIDLPAARKPGSAELVVQLNPSLGAVMLDALPYLNGYPYGCIEQTMSRFLPSMVTARTLQELGYKLEDLKRRAKLLEAQARADRRNGRADADSPYTYPQGAPSLTPAPFPRWDNPVFDSTVLRKMVDEGLARIRSFQHADGGWGWWQDDASDPYMSAYVLYGLITAREAGYTVNAKMLARGLDYLKGRFLEDDNLHRMAYEARVLAMEPKYRDSIRPLTTGRLYDRRERLSAYSKALLALALNSVGDREKALVLLGNIETTANIDSANGTVSWSDCDGYWWRWYNDRAETNAAILQAYMTIQPDSKLAPMLVKWLINNRQGDTWSSTQETAMAVYALADYVRVNKELAPDYTLTVDLGGRVQRRYKVTRENALFFDNRFVVPDALLQTGSQTLTITREGRGTCYYAAYTRYFSQEDHIAATGNEVFVTRRYFRLQPLTASGTPPPTPLEADRPNPFLTGRYELLDAGGETAFDDDTSGGPRYDRVALKPDETLSSGDLLEVELQLESKNDYDYLVFEDVKPAGCEPVEVRSGNRLGSGVYADMELRDQKVAFFLDELPQGTRTLSYRLRAEVPGQFHALPTNGYAVYAPAVRTLSEETDLSIQDTEAK